MDDPYIKALYSPELGLIAAPSLQAHVGGSALVSNMFPRKDWIVVPHDTLVPMEERQSVWEALASLSREERVRLADERGVRMRLNAIIGGAPAITLPVEAVA